MFLCCLEFFLSNRNTVRGSESTKLSLKNISLFGTSQKHTHTHKITDTTFKASKLDFPATVNQLNTHQLKCKYL